MGIVHFQQAIRRCPDANRNFSAACKAHGERSEFGDALFVRGVCVPIQ
jgi:hypothetical protein